MVWQTLELIDGKTECFQLLIPSFYTCKRTVCVCQILKDTLILSSHLSPSLSFVLLNIKRQSTVRLFAKCWKRVAWFASGRTKGAFLILFTCRALSSPMGFVYRGCAWCSTLQLEPDISSTTTGNRLLMGAQSVWPGHLH